MKPDTCPRCGKPTLVTGGFPVGRYMTKGTPAFIPDHLRQLQFRLKIGIPLQDPITACLDCGLVWSSVSPEELSAFMSKHGTDDRGKRSEWLKLLLFLGIILGSVLLVLAILSLWGK